MKICPVQWLALLSLIACLRAAEIRHDLLLIDEGNGNLLRVDQNDPSKNWIVQIDPKSPPEIKRPARWRAAPRDMQLIGNNRVLVSHDAGYSEFDLTTGQLVAEIATYAGVATVRRLPGGTTLIAGVDLGGAKGVVVLEVDRSNEIKRRTVFTGDYLRLMRETSQGTWLMMGNTMLRECDSDGRIHHEWPVTGFRHAWKAVRLRNGHLVASAGFGAFLVELDAAGHEVRRFAEKEKMPAVMRANFYAMFQLLPNGHVVFANWQAHGPGHGMDGIQLVEIDPAGDSGNLLWQYGPSATFSSLQGVIVIDGLDLSKLHDERNGLLEPIERPP